MVKLPTADPAEELTARLWKARAAYKERHRKEPTQAAIAKHILERTGVTVDQTTVGTWFQKTTPKPWVIKPLAEIYEIRWEWLLDGTGEMLEENPLRSALRRDYSPTIEEQEPPAKKKKPNPRKASGGRR